MPSEDDNCSVCSVDCSFDNSLFSEWIHYLGLTLHDQKILSSQARLTASHISAALKLLKRQFPDRNGLQDTSYLQQKSTWNSEPNKFIQIIYVDPNHWACLSNVLCSDENTIDLYDSSLTAPSADGSIVQQVSVILGTKCFDINLINVSLQFGGTDCGLFAIAMATDLANQTDPSSVRYEQPLMRSHLVCCLQELKLTPFPSQPRDIENRVLCTFRANIGSDGVTLSKRMFHSSSGFNGNFYNITLRPLYGEH